MIGHKQVTLGTDLVLSLYFVTRNLKQGVESITTLFFSFFLAFLNNFFLFCHGLLSSLLFTVLFGLAPGLDSFFLFVLGKGTPA